MSASGINQRLSMKARKAKFARSEEEIIVGWIIYRDLVMQSSTTDKLREYVSLFQKIV